MEDPGDGREPEVLKFTLNVATTDGAAAERQVVHMGDVPDEKRAQLDSSCANARTHLRANVELEVMDDATFLESAEVIRREGEGERGGILHGCLLRPKALRGAHTPPEHPDCPTSARVREEH